MNIEGTLPSQINGKINDPSQALAEVRGQYIDIYHIPSGRSVRFKAYVKDYSDDYRSDWSDEKVYGRMDPIVQFQGTERVITLEWDVIASSFEECVLNHKKCSLLFAMLYPSYEPSSAQNSSATLINTAPLFKVKFGNLIQTGESVFGESVGTNAQENGLVGKITGFSYRPDFETGFYDQVGGSKFLPNLWDSDNPGTPPVFNGTPGTMLPIIHGLSMEFTVLHTEKLGWKGEYKRSPYFPHGLNFEEPAGNNGASNNLTEQNQNNVNSILGGGQ
jgi:hypothetical protein